MFAKQKLPTLSPIFLFLIIIICAGNSAAQISVVNAENFVGSKLNATLTARQMNDRMKTVFGAANLPQAAQAVDLYKVSYRSLNEKGNAVILTGLVALPITSAIFRRRATRESRPLLKASKRFSLSLPAVTRWRCRIIWVWAMTRKIFIRIRSA